MGLFKRKNPKNVKIVYIEKSNHEDIEQLKRDLKETKLKLMWRMLTPRQREKLRKMIAEQKTK